jgi:hypothetical protein
MFWNENWWEKYKYVYDYIDLNIQNIKYKIIKS